MTTNVPEKNLTVALRHTGGRNNVGRMSIRHIGGGNKTRYRIIDFRRMKDGVPGTVETIEYDPNRSPRIALIKYKDGERRYILAPDGLKVGDVVESGEKLEPKIGNAMPLKSIPTGQFIHNVELTPGQGGQMALVDFYISRKYPARDRVRHGAISRAPSAERFGRYGLLATMYCRAPIICLI